MARKESITMDQILDSAFCMAREEGFDSVTARKLAARTGCSTQPIFRVYKNMEELWAAVYERSVEHYQNYYEKYPEAGEVPFSRMGMAYIDYAREEKHLFELLFVSDAGKSQVKKKSMYEILNGKNGNVVREVAQAQAHGCKDPGELFMRMWIFIHGAACMTLTGDYDLSREETLELMKRTYQAFLNS